MSSLLRTLVLSAVVSFVVSIVVVSGISRAPSTTPATDPLPTRTLREESAIITAVKAAEPAVVSVIISKDLPVLERYYEEVPLSPFYSMRVPRVRQRGTERQEVGGGTAFFVSEEGLLLTNRHVVSDEQAAYTVLLNDGQRFDATVVARDPLSDVALLQVRGSGFPYLKLSDDDTLLLGQTAIAIGNALAEFRNTVSVGVISGLQRSITAGSPSRGEVETLHRIIQTDAAINSGNSGGPLIDIRGQVIGMNTAVASGAQNIGFALPVADLRRVLQSYARHGRIIRPYLGIRYTPITPALQEALDLRYDYGVILQRGEAPEDPAVAAGSPAERAGLRENDIILEFEGTKLTADVFLADLIAAQDIDSAVRMKVARDGREMTIDARLEEWKEP